ncbi:MAG: 2-C-methyl-D-erythritol 4-phosphate cytidylyltransferase [Candidatus Omnitrophota bacterium]
MTALVLAAGKGERLKHKVSKPLVLLNAQPVIAYSLRTLDTLVFIKDIVVVADSSNRAGILKVVEQFRFRKIRQVVIGGARRQDSLGRGLAVLDRRTDLVLVHDAARPFADKRSITAAVREAARCGAAVVGVPVKATIKKCISASVHKCMCVKETLKRDELWEIQTPQVFKKELIVRAFGKFGREDVTDDAMLVEKTGARVSVVRGTYNNIKITTPEDLVIAEAFLKTHRVQKSE